MSVTSPDSPRPSLALAPLPGLEAEEPLFPVDPQAVVADPPSLQEGLCAATLLWSTHSSWPTVRAIAAAAARRADVLAVHDVRLTRLPLIAALPAGVHDAQELAAFAGAVRHVPAA